MNIIIVGCGKVGQTIATHLYEEKHNITVIDSDAKRLNELLNTVDCMGICGNGAVVSVLKEAMVEACDILIAVTQSDEVNMICCLMAKKISKCRTIARVRKPEYSAEINYIKDMLGISLIINPEYATANEISRILRYSSTLSADSFFDDKVNLLKVVVTKDSKINNMKIMNIQKELNCDVLLCVIERKDEVIIPKGKNIVKENDKISFIADRTNAISFLKHAGFNYKHVKNILVIGGGRITYYLTSILKNTDCSIKIIENNKAVANTLAEELVNASVVYGDGSNKKLLYQEGLKDVDAIITLTGIDEENIMISLFASKETNAKILTKVNRISFEDILKDLNLGTIINPKTVTANIIIQYIRSLVNAKGSKVQKLYKICDGNAEALEFNVEDDTAIVGYELKDLKFKENVLIACIYRNGNTIISNGKEKILKGDKVVVITKNNQFNTLQDVLM